MFLCSAAVGPGPDYFEPKLLMGSIYDKEGGHLLFTFRRTATHNGDAVHVLREFRNPAGALAAQERVLYEGGRLVRFELDELQIGSNGRAVVKRLADKQWRIDFQYKGSDKDAKPKSKSETVGEEALISDSLPVFLAAHWAELNAGTVVKFRYLVVPRLETISFKFSRESTGEFHGRKVVRIKMEPSSWVIAQIVDPLIFTVESEPPHRVLQYWGRTTPKIRNGQSWRDLDGLSVFNWN
ncbi:MAG TPA: hypothetical protein VJ063_20360 [Verrucomicrobiae bacterium]|nr:hypothetical protein [Verrucomicrobiae bacterium]